MTSAVNDFPLKLHLELQNRDEFEEPLLIHYSLYPYVLSLSTDATNPLAFLSSNSQTKLRTYSANKITINSSRSDYAGLPKC